MECNRDEAVRAKTIAEEKLANRDFAGAKKFSLKAQALYPELEGLSQMLTTLDVYISAENKVSGEVDWYGVLGVNPTDDEETIRKHYRKLALMLHPDKNKSVGADGAFKLLSEAWSLLSDKTRRLAYNQRRGSRGIHQKVTFQSGGQSSAGTSVNGFSNFTQRTSKPKSHKSTAAAARMGVPRPFPRTDTFWTICQRCKMHYEYLKVYLNHTLLCPNCQEPFLASEMPPPVNFPKPSAHQRHQNSSNRGPSSSPFDPGRNPATSTLNFGGGSSGINSSNKHSNVQRSPFFKVNVGGSAEPSIAAKAANVVQQVNERLKKREESYAGWPSKKIKADDDTQYYGVKIPYQMADGGAFTGNITGLYGKINGTRELTPLETRNMLMHKARAEILGELSKWRSQTKQSEKKASKKDDKFVKSNSHNPNGNVGSSAGESVGQAAVEERQALAMSVPDPDFYDFDLDRTENSFQDNQVWAGYDDDDGMPRVYALIHKVISRKPFKVKISWLNSKSNIEFGSIGWVGSGFSKTCGEFRVGKHEVNNSLNSFSHKVEWIKGARGTVLIFPRKGDVWALYRNWSPHWNEHTPDNVIHKYDMVQVLDDYTEEHGTSVIPLVKVSGFRTVFHPHLDRSRMRRIPKEEMFRFSHRVPKYLLTGKEARNAPRGCLELDPAATPLDLLQVNTETDAPQVTDVEMVENGEEIIKEIR